MGEDMYVRMCTHACIDVFKYTQIIAVKVLNLSVYVFMYAKLRIYNYQM